MSGRVSSSRSDNRSPRGAEHKPTKRRGGPDETVLDAGNARGGKRYKADAEGRASEVGSAGVGLDYAAIDQVTIDARIKAAVEAIEPKFVDLQHTFYEQDELIVLKKFFPLETIQELLPFMEQARPYLNRNYIPMHKKGGSVSSHVLRQRSPTFVNLYQSPVLLNFLTRLTDTHGELMTCPNADAHCVALYYYTEPGDHIGYHYDTSFYKGNRYTMLVGLQDNSSCELVSHLYRDNPKKETQYISTKIEPGDVVLFNGDKLYHAVTPLKEGESRVIITMEFVTDPAMSAVSRGVSDLKDAVTYFGVTSLIQGHRTRAIESVETRSLAASPSDPNRGTLPQGNTRVVAFVNKKSGARAGGSVLTTLQTLLGRSNVHDLQDSNWTSELERHLSSSDSRPLRVIACGGDGTIRWVIQEVLRRSEALERKGHKVETPSIGILPIGTGNDLAREFGWGSGFDPASSHSGSNYDLARRIRLSSACSQRPMDVWNVTFNDGKESEAFFNYFNVGFDPQVASSFHNMRNSLPSLFRSRTINKAWYGAHALKSVLGGSYDLSACIEVTIDGQTVEIPRGLQTLVVLNMKCYQAGADLWGSDSADSSALSGSPQIDDGLIEVVGISSLAQNALLRLDLGSGVRIGRGSVIQLRTKIEEDAPALPMACDGEPFSSSSAEITISRATQVPVLVNDVEEL